MKPVIPHEFPSSNGDRTAAESVELCEPHVKPVLLHAFPSPDRDRTAAESVELCDAHVPSDDCYVSSLFLAPPSDSNNVLLPSSNKRKNCQSECSHIDVTTGRPSKTARKSHVCLNSSGSAPTRSFQHHALEHQLAEQKQPPCDSASIGTRCRRQIYYDYHTVAQASSYTGNQLHRQAQAAQAQASRYTFAQATSYTGNQLHKQRKQGNQLHRQPVTQATGYTGNQLHRQPVIHAA